MKISILLVAALLAGQMLFAQNDDLAEVKKELQEVKSYYKPGKSKFLLRGYAHAGLSSTKDNFTFEGGSFNPLFIYKQSDRLLFESEMELELEGDALNVGLEYSNISYLLTKSLTVRAGKILIPFGIYVPNMHPAWIDKFGSKPLGLGHDGILPSADIGFEIGGGSYLGSSKINYAFYIVNGPRLNTGMEEPEEAGRLHYGIVPDNNRSKTIGGRLGFIPFSNSMLEIGLSGMYGKVGDQDTKYENVASGSYAADLSFVKNITSIKSILDIKAQYSTIKTDEAMYFDDDEVPYNFINNSSTFFAQVSVKPAFVENVVVRKLEIAARYSKLTTPENSLWEINQNQMEFGLNYWLDWRTVFKLTYKVMYNNGADHAEGEPEGHGEKIPGNALLFHWAIGF